LIGGQLDAIFNNLQAAATQSKAGHIRILAVSGPARSRRFPDVPTMDEIIPGTIGEAWFGISGPKGIPTEIISHLEDTLAEIIQDENVREQLGGVGMTPMGLRQPEFAVFLGEESKKWAPIIEAADIKLN